MRCRGWKEGKTRNSAHDDSQVHNLTEEWLSVQNKNLVNLVTELYYCTKIQTSLLGTSKFYLKTFFITELFIFNPTTEKTDFPYF